MSVYFAIFILDAVYRFGFLQRGCSEMGNFDVGMESLVVGIYEFRNTCQRNGRAIDYRNKQELLEIDILKERATKLLELLGKQVKILELKEDIQKTY